MLVDIRIEIVLHLLRGWPRRVVFGHVHVAERVGFLGVLGSETGIATRLGPHTSDIRGGFKEDDLVSVLGEVFGGRDAGESGAYDGDFHGDWRRGGRRE